MKLLILTQKVDRTDSVLGFFHTWLVEFSKRAELVTVIALEVGEYQLPQNVTVTSLGKELGVSKVVYLWRLFSTVIGQQKKYDAVFVHMNPIYVVLCGWFWKLTGKKIALWYTHRQVDLKLRIAEKFTGVIFTASKESFQLTSSKVQVVGHGIDIAAYDCPTYVSHTGPLTLVSVGRITPIKRCEVAIEALGQLNKLWDRQCTLRFIGGPATLTDQAYFETLKKKVADAGLSDRVMFMGSVPYTEIRKEYCLADATFNLTPTGGVDKAVLESMASGRIVFSSNQTFADYFKPYAPMLLVKDNDPLALAQAIREVFALHKETEITSVLRSTATARAGVGQLVDTIYSVLHSGI
ncbi:MAG: glycosyltransferase family 4 protein [Patescibacteria group bacterium]